MATIRVNGRQWEVSSPPDTPLLYVLMNELELKGPRFGCGLAQCGSCSVLVDGVAHFLPTRFSTSCQMKFVPNCVAQRVTSSMSISMMRTLCRVAHSAALMCVDRWL